MRMRIVMIVKIVLMHKRDDVDDSGCVTLDLRLAETDR